MYYTNDGINLYQGDMQIGDREATIKEVEAYESKKELAFKVNEAKAYLADTAWYIERFNDPSSGKAIPQEVLDGRAQARVTINELEVV